jgi:hypothetical protein
MQTPRKGLIKNGLFISALLTHFGCSPTVDNPASAPPPLPAETPKFAGYYNDGSKTVPCYRDGATLHGLGGSLTKSACAYSPVATSGGTVYTAGYYYTAGDVPVPCYWIGDTFHSLDGPLSGGTYSSYAFTSAIALSGGKIYTAGYYSEGSVYVPCYWEGSGLHSLKGSLTESAYANAIKVVGETVYVGGGNIMTGRSTCPAIGKEVPSTASAIALPREGKSHPLKTCSKTDLQTRNTVFPMPSAPCPFRLAGHIRDLRAPASVLRPSADSGPSESAACFQRALRKPIGRSP